MDLEILEKETTVGRLALVFRAGTLCAIQFNPGERAWRQELQRRFGPVTLHAGRGNAGIVDRIDAYFDGDCTAIEPIPVDAGGTEFQRQVWHALRQIPAGTTCSYGELAAAIGRPGAMRAVGAANGANPVSIVVPCHRVIASDGRLHGYGGGLDRKRWLLTHEGLSIDPSGKIIEEKKSGTLFPSPRAEAAAIR